MARKGVAHQDESLHGEDAVGVTEVVVAPEGPDEGQHSLLDLAGWLPLRLPEARPCGGRHMQRHVCHLDAGDLLRAPGGAVDRRTQKATSPATRSLLLSLHSGCRQESGATEHLLFVGLTPNGAPVVNEVFCPHRADVAVFLGVSPEGSRTPRQSDNAG